MYTLTRKLAVVCLTLVLSVLVYGCGGSSKQALITDVSTDMVTTGLTPESGTYTIQPGGTANAGDVTFACPAEGAPCEVTVAEDGTITSPPGSAPGMATAMDSDSAAARLAAVAEAEASEAARLAAVAEAEASEAARVAAVAAAEASEAARVAAVAAAEASEAARVAAVAAAEASEAARVAAVAEAMAAEVEKAAAVAAANASEEDRVAAVAAAMAAEEDRVAAVAAAMAAEEDRVAAVAAAMAAEEDRVAAVAAAMAAEEDRVAAVAEAMVAEEDRVAAVAVAMAAEVEKAAAVAAAETSEAARVAAVAAAEASEAARVAAVAEAEASEAARVAAVAEAEASEEARVAAVAEAEASEAARVAAVAVAMAAEVEKAAAVAAAMVAEEARVAAVAAAMVAEEARVAAVAAAMVAEEARVAAVAATMIAEAARDDAVAATMIAEAARDDALEALVIANRRANAKPVDISNLLTGYTTITPGSYTIEADDSRDVDDVNFACPADGIACEVIVDGEGNVVSAGGEATAQNSMAAMTTRTAIALFAPINMGTLVTASGVGPVVVVNDMTDAAAADSVARSPEGVTTITLAHAADLEATTNEYTSEVVDTGHEIEGWIGQTLKRDDSMAATMEVEAEPATIMDEVTAYTNIDPATRGKLMYEGIDNAIPDIAVYRIEVEADQMYSNDDGDTFRGAFIRTDGTRILGTFTCDADVSCAAISSTEGEETETVVGTLVLAMNPGLGWEFDSDENVTEGETPDTDYMYFGYWLQSPVEGTTYAFSILNGGGNQPFVIDDELTNDSHALTATYEGGAAGLYVTRELRVRDGSVDVYSPGFHGRFTANAMIKAYFGTNDEFAGNQIVTPNIPSKQNMIEGTITDFMDGDTELGFKVTLERTMIGDGTGISGMATAEFGKPGDSMATAGTWGAKLFGPSPDADSSQAAKNRTVPSGVAGQFDVNSSYTKVVGAFAAEKQ